MRTVPGLPFGSTMIFLFVAVFAAGCSREPALFASAEQNLSCIGIAYDKASRKAGHPPHSTEDLKPTLQQLGYPESVLVSPNDGQPFVIRWGVPALRPGRTKGVFPILAHEAVGVDGKKYVLDNMLGVRQMAEAELDQALQVKK